jgi:hypothetical protein
MGIHLLGKLARDLDRLDLRGEGTAENPLDEALDSCFEVAKDADGWLSSSSWPGWLVGWPGRDKS